MCWDPHHGLHMPVKPATHELRPPLSTLEDGVVKGLFSLWGCSKCVLLNASLLSTSMVLPSSQASPPAQGTFHVSVTKCLTEKLPLAPPPRSLSAWLLISETVEVEGLNGRGVWRGHSLPHGGQEARARSQAKVAPRAPREPCRHPVSRPVGLPWNCAHRHPQVCLSALPVTGDHHASSEHHSHIVHHRALGGPTSSVSSIESTIDFYPEGPPTPRAPSHIYGMEELTEGSCQV